MMSNEPFSTYGTDPWRIIERSFTPERIPADETIFATGNGYLGMRGAFEERTPVYHPGTYINGIYEVKPIVYGEHAYGFAKLSQTILNLTDAGIIRLYVDDDLFDLATGKVLEYYRALDMESGVLERRVVWESPSGKKIALQVKRVVSFVRRHVAAFEWRCETVGCEATLTVLSSLNMDVRNLVGFDDPRVGASFKERVLVFQRKKVEGNLATISAATRNSRFSVVSAAEDRLLTENMVTTRTETDRHRVTNRYSVFSRPGVPVQLERYTAYYTSRDTGTSKLTRLVKKEVRLAAADGVRKLFSEQKAFLDEFWKRCDIRIDGDPLMNQSIRFNIYHILQGTGTDGFTNAPAKGLTGEGYDGHYFWDSEIYILPIFAYSHPRIARKMLEFRYRTLDEARVRAEELRHRGALFPWRTISGVEASAYFPAGTAQYHINADIVFAMKKYVEISGDSEFLCECAAETALETARFWLSLGDYIPGRGFCFNTVTGPDEYSALVNNNVYTNLMARMNLEYAAWAMEHLRENYPQDYSRIAEKTDFDEREAEEWRNAASSIFIPFNEELGVYAQDDSFFNRARWDFESGKDRHPLLLHFHPLTIYRYQVLKQPDLVLAQFLLGSFFSAAEKKRNFDFYDPLITGDSSLAPCIQSTVSAELGYTELAYEYFSKTARMDLDNINGNVRDGVHMAAMAGSWTALIYGFAGLRDYDGRISFRPSLPSRWNRLTFRLTVRGCLLEVEIGKNAVRYTLLEGEELELLHVYRELHLTEGDTVEVGLEPELSAVIFDRDGIPDEEWAKPELRRLLQSLSRRGIRTALVSERLDGSMLPAAVPVEQFSQIYGGSSIVKGRPDPEIFLNTAEALRELPRDCAVITAAPEGARAAEAGGFFVVMKADEYLGRGTAFSGYGDLDADMLHEAVAREAVGRETVAMTADESE